MPKPTLYRERLEELVSLARAYRNWSVKELAAELGRDSHNLVPESGIPRLDLVIQLADALDWKAQDVIDELSRPPQSAHATVRGAACYSELDRKAFELHQGGRYRELVSIAEEMLRVAETGSERANARIREFCGWDGLGRYSLALAAVHEGLREQDIAAGVALTLRTNLAHCHYVLGNLDESIAIATCLLAKLQTGPCEGAYFEGSLGYLHYVRGSCLRMLAAAPSVERPAQVQQAVADLTTGQALLLRAAELHSVPVYRVAAKMCEGALLELRTLRGEIDAAASLEAIMTALDGAVDPAKSETPAMLEAWGWWCIFGCNIAIRHCADPGQVERFMGVFTNKADEIAARLGNWPLRERVWTMELHRRELAARDVTEINHPSLDDEDMRSIVGSMARFPAFRATGWSILRSGQAL